MLIEGCQLQADSVAHCRRAIAWCPHHASLAQVFGTSQSTLLFQTDHALSSSRHVQKPQLTV